MSNSAGRNDPCPCGSGKKYKQCCMNKPPLLRRKFTAISQQPKPLPNLMDRTFGEAAEKELERDLLVSTPYPITEQASSSPAPESEM